MRAFKILNLNGQAFLPIYNTVLPALTAFANKIEAITANLAAFSISIFGKATSVQVIQEQTDAIAGQGDAIGGQGDAIEKAGKQAKKAIAPFDEINTLASGSAGSGGSGSGGGAGGGGSSSTIEPVTIEASDKAGTFKVIAGFEGFPVHIITERQSISSYHLRGVWH